MPKILGGKVDYLSMTTARLLGPADIRTLASELDITPTKKLGQNFLHDPNTVRMIITTTQFTDVTNRHVLEVGPGLGSLTLGLVTGSPAPSLNSPPTMRIGSPSAIGTP